MEDSINSFSLNSLCGFINLGKQKDDDSFILIDSENNAELALKALGNERKSVDVETYVVPEHKYSGLYTALNHNVSRISLLAVYSEVIDKTFVFDILKLKESKETIKTITNMLQDSEYLVAHNSKFEWKQFYLNFGVKLENLHCTYQLARLHGNATGSKFARLRELSLKALLKDFFDIKMTGKGNEQITDWYIRPEEGNTGQIDYWYSKVKYSAYDVKHLFLLHDSLENVLTLPSRRSIFNSSGATKGPYGLNSITPVEQSYYMIAVIGEMELNGFPGSPIIKEITNAIYDEQSKSGYLMEIASKICQQLHLTTTPSLWEEYPIPTAESLKLLNNPQKLCELLVTNTNLPLDTAQTQTLQRIVALLEQVYNDGEVKFADGEEEDKYSELNELENSVAIQFCELAKLIIEYKRLFKLWGMSLDKHIDLITGCIHSSYNENGAATGRTASSQP